MSHDTQTLILFPVPVCWSRGDPSQGGLRGRSSSFPPLGPYGDYLCDSPSHLVTSAMRFMREKMGDEADFILWTG